MRETVTIQVGQCGNAIGNAFWRNLLEEHRDKEANNDSLSAFFHESSGRGGDSKLKARAVLVDMECGPLQETMRSDLGSLFDETQFVMDVSGAGNNFAHGHCHYGPQYREKLTESLRRTLEHCDAVQSFLVLHSLGGGTGSGVGTYMLGLVEDLFPDVYRFAVSVYPSEDDDVVTSPYNSILATRQLIDHADCVFPLNNSALSAFAQLRPTAKDGGKRAVDGSPDELKGAKDKGFNKMNNVAGQMLCHLTSSSRFDGEMNVDMNEICTNLVPFPRLHFLTTALTPQRTVDRAVRGRPVSSIPPKGAVQRAFTDLLAPAAQLSALGINTKDRGVYLACAFLGRGKIPLSDFINGVTAVQTGMRFPDWNQDACKIGLCSTPAPGEVSTIMGIYNSTAFGGVLDKHRKRFNQLYRRKAMLHHYTEFIEEDFVADSDESVARIIQEYDTVEKGGLPHASSDRNTSQYYMESLLPLF
jgi:tubulin epsilon